MNAQLVGSSVEGVYLGAVDLTAAEVLGGSLRGSNFAAARLPGTVFGPWLGVGTDLRRAGFVEASFAGTRFVLAQLGEAVFEAVDCSDTEADQACVTFEDADLRDARFEGTALLRPSFIRADLSGATFVDTAIEGGAWAGVTMERGELTDTTVTGVLISGTRLSGMGLAGVTFAGTDFEDVCIENLRTRSVELGAPAPGVYSSVLRDGELRGVRLVGTSSPPIRAPPSGSATSTSTACASWAAT